MSTAEPLLEVRDLKVHFAFKRRSGPMAKPMLLRAVDGVSFRVRPGETLGVVCESGCGKSTLGRAILQLIPVTSGEVVWLGRSIQDLGKLSHEAMRLKRQEMQIIFQDPLASLNPRMPVGEIIAEPAQTFQPNLSRAQVRDKVKAMMAKVGLLPNQINRYPHEFSGGQCQRIGIARAMINNPKLIVCDEPVSALDVSIQAQIVNLLMDLQRETGMALIFISHNLSVVRHISHRIMVLYLGRVAELASRDQLYRNPRHPYTQALISAVPIPDPDREANKPQVMLAGDLPSPFEPPSGCLFRTRCSRATALCAEAAPPAHLVSETHSVFCHHWRE